jgi:hypothetical protein
MYFVFSVFFCIDVMFHLVRLGHAYGAQETHKLFTFGSIWEVREPADVARLGYCGLSLDTVMTYSCQAHCV